MTEPTPDAPLPDYDLPGNDLDPGTPTPEQTRKLSLATRIYGVLCLVDGVVTAPVLALFMVLWGWALITDPAGLSINLDPTLTIIIFTIGIVIAVANAIALVVFGITLLRNHRRRAALVSHVLIATTIVEILVLMMLQGIGAELIRPGVQLIILIALSVTVDPSLHEERKLQRHLRDLEDREAAARGMLGRDLEGTGYIELNFFNLFWVFVVCSILGLIIEVIFHMVWVDPGVYQDRAGLLFGPFSPIYGVGACLMTIALNRFYKSNPVIIFVVSAIIGGVFEAFVSWFMQTAFGAVAWDYTGTMIFGIADPVATIFQGRTSTPFMLMWGGLGFVWIKLCLPRLLKLINLIPWKIRYSFTALCAALMLINAIMTLQALDCWFERLSGTAGTTPVEEFYARNFDNEYMENRFQSMTITPESSNRVEPDAGTQ